MAKTCVKIEYFGHFIDLAGKASELFETSSDLRQAYTELLDYLKKSYAIGPPFILMIGNQHILGALKKRGDLPLGPDEVFRLIPFMSGG